MTQTEKKLDKILEDLAEAVKYGQDATDAEKAAEKAKDKILKLFNPNEQKNYSPKMINKWKEKLT